MNVVFRVDASNQMGSGHVMRCLTLAQALRERDAACTFICRELDGNLISLIKDRGFMVCILSNYEEGYVAQGGDVSHASWLGCDWETDCSETQIHLEKLKPDWLIVDHYGIDTKWEEALNFFYNKLLVIDDLADRNHICDVLLDQNLVEGNEDRYTSLVPEHATHLLGPRFALLQHEYARLHATVEPISKHIQRLLIYFGATDSSNLTTRAITSFLKLKSNDIEVDVVLPAISPSAKEIVSRFDNHANIHFHSTQPSLARLFLNADLALGAGGVTNWERMCVGLYAMVITVSDNQIPIAQKLHSEKLIRWLGNDVDVNENLIQGTLEEFIQHGVSKDSIKRCLAVVDGKGITRVCDLLFSFKPSLYCRKANVSDEKILLEWTNDPITRNNSFTSAMVSSEEHHNWFASCLANIDSCRLYVVESHPKYPIGTVRFHREDAGWEIHFSLAPRSRGWGLGKMLVEIAIESLRQELGRVTIVGQVKQENATSAHIFKSLGFELLPTTKTKQPDSLVFQGEFQ